MCNYGWTKIDAAVVCHQLGLVLNPKDWYLQRSEIPQAGTAEKILLRYAKVNAGTFQYTLVVKISFSTSVVHPGLIFYFLKRTNDMQLCRLVHPSVIIS